MGDFVGTPMRHLGARDLRTVLFWARTPNEPLLGPGSRYRPRRRSGNGPPPLTK